MFKLLKILRGQSLLRVQTFIIVAPSFILSGYNEVAMDNYFWSPFLYDQKTMLSLYRLEGGGHQTLYAFMKGLVTSTLIFGALIGSLGCTLCGDTLGRRKSIIIAAFIALIGQIICLASPNINIFMVGRSTIGVAIGILSPTVSVWQSECSPSVLREKHIILQGIFTSLGLLIASCVQQRPIDSQDIAPRIYRDIHPGIYWYLPLSFQVIFSVVLLIGIFDMPESPRWLVKTGHDDEAIKTLSRLKNTSTEDTSLNVEVNEIRTALYDSNAEKVSFKDMFTMSPDKLLFRFGVCFILRFYQQMTGTNSVLVYASSIFESGPYLSSKKWMTPFMISFVMISKFASSFIPFFILDRFYRRVLFMYCGIGIGVCMMILTVTRSGAIGDFDFMLISTGVATSIYNCFTSTAFLSIDTLYSEEVAPISHRIGVAATIAANRYFWNILALILTPITFETIEYWCFFIFGIIGFSMPLVVYYLFPETMGHTREEMEIIFKENETIRDVVKASITCQSNTMMKNKEKVIEERNSAIATQLLESD